MKVRKPVAEPLIKWAGGKRWAIKMMGPQIEAHLQETGGVLIDPFFGGGALPLWYGGPMIISDACRHIMEMYELIRDDPGLVAWTLSAVAIYGVEDTEIEGGVDRAAFERIKAWRPTDPVHRAARVLYLNRLGFNGLWRVNKSGAFNVPYADAKYRPSVIGRSARDKITSLFPNKEKFHKVAKALADAEIYRCDFEPVIELADASDLLFVDPPYDGGGYDQYTAERFGDEDQERLAEAILDADDRGAAIIAFNRDTGFVRDLYDGFDFIETQEKRQINSDTTKRKTRAPCVIITNRPELIGDGTETRSSDSTARDAARAVHR